GPQIGKIHKILGGKDFSFGVMAGGIMPVISATSSGNFTGSVVNYSLGDNSENVSYSASPGYNIGVYMDMRIHNNLYVTPGVNFVAYKYENSFEFDFIRDVPSSQPHYYIKGYTQNTYREKYSMKILEVPVLFSYRFPINENSHFQLDMGPVISYGIMAGMNVNGTSDSETMTAYWIKDNEKTDIVYSGIVANDMHYTGTGEFNLYGNYVDYKQIHTVSNGSAQTFSYATNVKDAPIKRLNFAMSIGALYEISGFGIGVYYNYMFTNMANQKYWNSERWPIFQQTANLQMTDYSQKNNYLSLKISYTFRFDK
ncbi:MAG: outer membrane beta-barrel protein, partial [Bacteroidales bacterium]|nr:outer membrane beta-barrel protein [Bacteroidales bacterium]